MTIVDTSIKNTNLDPLSVNALLMQLVYPSFDMPALGAEFWGHGIPLPVLSFPRPFYIALNILWLESTNRFGRSNAFGNTFDGVTNLTGSVVGYFDGSALEKGGVDNVADVDLLCWDFVVCCPFAC